MQTSARMAQARSAHLQALHEVPALGTPAYEAWTATRLDRMVADYLLRSGAPQTAALLAQKRGMQDLCDLEIFRGIGEVGETLLAHHQQQQQGVGDGSGATTTKPSCTAALAWCAENKAALKKIKVSNAAE